VTYQKAVFLDMVYLQQDAFDPVDASVPLDRQKSVFKKVYEIARHPYKFESKEDAREFFIRLTGLFKNFNYAAKDSRDYGQLMRQIDDLSAHAP
jgi:V/A-type H+-transporting ATPase subunit A